MPNRIKGQIPKHLWREVHLQPQENRAIMFNSWLWHTVEPNQCLMKTRISVSFNFLQIMAFNKYHVIKNALSYELANFIFNYFLT